MRNKKILSALMALTMVASMTAVSVSAEDNAQETDVIIYETNNAGEVLEDAPEETQAPEPEQTEAPVTSNDVENWTETDAPAETKATETTALTETTTMTETTVKGSMTEDAATTTTTEKTTSALTAPTLGEFKIVTFEDLNPGTEGGGGSNAIIAWNPVEGADGYQVYRVLTLEENLDIPTSQAFDVKGTSYQTTWMDMPNSESVKVRAFQIVNGERVYGPWSETKTVYLNGMEPPATTTAKSTSAEKKSTTTTTASKENKTESPKTGDSTNLPAVACAAVSALLAGAVVRKKRK